MPEHRYRPVGSAAELLRCREFEVLLSGQVGTGKSRACLEKMHAMAMANPGMRGLIVRKTAQSLTTSALVTFREHVAGEALASGEMKFYGGSGQLAASYQYGNGSTIVVGGMDKASRIMSSEYDVIYVQEATELTEEDWESLVSRLRNYRVSFQQLMADCNPSYPHHWLKRRCDAGSTKLITCRFEDNPVWFDKGSWTPQGEEYVARLKANLSGVRRQRWLEGRWAAADGLVYDGFDPDVHVRKPFSDGPPRDWPRYWSVDFGFTNPFVCQFWAADPDGRLILYREIYRTQGLVEDHAAEMLRVMRTVDRGTAPLMVICDHDAEGRATLEEKLGMGTIKAKKDVLEGIEAVKTRMKLAADGKPRIYLCRDAVVKRDPLLEQVKKPCSTVEEIGEYVWESGSVRRPGILPDAPRKENDHGMDAMRYLVAEIDLRSRPRLTWIR